MSNRGNFKIFIFGQSRTGKSVTAKIISDIVRSKNKYEKIIVHDPQNRFKDIRTDYIKNFDAMDKFIIDKGDNAPSELLIKNSLVIIDETMKFFNNNQVSQSFLEFLSLAGEQNIDVIYIAHHPIQIPPKVAITLTHYICYYTGSGDNHFKSEKLQNVDTVFNSMKTLQAYVKQYPKGVDGFGEYETSDPKKSSFPYAFIDILQNNVKFINMPEIKIKNKTVEIPYNAAADINSKSFNAEKYGKYN